MKSLESYICEVLDPSKDPDCKPIGNTGMYYVPYDGVKVKVEKDNSLTVSGSGTLQDINIIGGKGVKVMDITINAQYDKIGVHLLSDWATEVRVHTTGQSIAVAWGNDFTSKLPKCKVIDLSDAAVHSLYGSGSGVEELIGGTGQLGIIRVQKCPKLKLIDLSRASSLGRDEKTSQLLMNQNKSLQDIKLPKQVYGWLTVPKQITDSILKGVKHVGQFIQK